MNGMMMTGMKVKTLKNKIMNDKEFFVKFSVLKGNDHVNYRNKVKMIIGNIYDYLKIKHTDVSTAEAFNALTNNRRFVISNFLLWSHYNKDKDELVIFIKADKKYKDLLLDMKEKIQASYQQYILAYH